MVCDDVICTAVGLDIWTKCHVRRYGVRDCMGWGQGRFTVTRKTVSSNILRNFICDVGQINFDSKLLPGLYGFGRKASSSATVVLRRHTWYLTEDLISLALFDDSLPEDTRNSLAQAIGQLPPVVIEIRKPTLPDLHSQSWLLLQRWLESFFRVWSCLQTSQRSLPILQREHWRWQQVSAPRLRGLRRHTKTSCRCEWAL